jgi:hypothetical protein
MTARTTVTAEHVVWVTAFRGVVDHAVIQSDLAAGSRQPGRGFRSVCGERFWSAPMICEPGPRCDSCTRHVRARATMRSANERLSLRRDSDANPSSSEFRCFPARDRVEP